ncbi:unnamed protein product [Effrenium voratum]|uniref:CBM20 domain-containing protein n=1 Tax=Effrenium voratum TaxID=2562239 RepID=A0AA36I455_9DINO|nr:unnamed protein product [Effrenium voratum]
MAAPEGSVTFNVRADTSFGDRIVLVGSGDALGNWNPCDGGVELTTTEKDYPVWKSPTIKLGKGAEYKYVRLKCDGDAVWEFDGGNRQISAEDLTQSSSIVVDDGFFGELLGDHFSYPEVLSKQVHRGSSFDRKPAENALQLVVVGDDVAAGHGAAGYKGWSAELGRLLNEQFGYGYSNVAEIGFNMQEALRRGLTELLPKPPPQVVVIAFSAELRWLANCPDWERQTICDNTIKAMAALVADAWDAGIMPVLAGFCPHESFEREQADLLRRADSEMRSLGAPVLDWLHALSPGGDKFGKWTDGLANCNLYPNTTGHQRMLASVNQSIFEPLKVKDLLMKRAAEMADVWRLCFQDGRGLEIHYCLARKEVQVSNTTQDVYELNPGWGEMQSSLAATFTEAPWTLRRGLYVRFSDDQEALFSLFLGDSGTLQSGGKVPAGSTVKLRLVDSKLQGLPAGSTKLFCDDNLQVVRTAEGRLQLFNQANCEYNVHPMWYDVRQATKAVQHGVYEDASGLPFRTAIISCHGLQSRVKVPAKSAVELCRVGDLKSIQQVAVLPLGDRCSTRMLLHKIEFDGPCYPFDLTRTTSLADVADMAATGFEDMWNPDCLYYDGDVGRIFHRKWNGLSFAHEVEYEQGEDPIGNFAPIVERMRKRYTSRAARFEWACKNADSVLFVRTGVASRAEVSDLLSRMQQRYPDLQAKLLLISDQDTGEFSGLANVTHIRESFDPDRMYEDMNYWINCAHRFRGILEGVGITARNLYWCPNNLKEAEKELEGAAENGKKESGKESGLKATKLTSEIAKFSHANLYELHQVHIEMKFEKDSPKKETPAATGFL